MNKKIFAPWSSPLLPHKFDVRLCSVDDAIVNWSYDSNHIVTDEIIEFMLKTVTKGVNKFYEKTVKKYVLEALKKNDLKKSHVRTLPEYYKTSTGSFILFWLN